MIVEPTHNTPGGRHWSPPFGDCPPHLGVAEVSAPDTAAAALPCLRDALAAAGAAPALRRATIVRERGRAPRLAGTLSGLGAWRLSLTHSGTEIAAAAACEMAVGIDLERHRPRDFPRLSRLLGWSAVTAAAFYPRWTLAEALYKAGAAASPACFAAAEHALTSAPQDLSAGLDLLLLERRWQVRWRQAPATTDGPASTTCIVWSDAA